MPSELAERIYNFVNENANEVESALIRVSYDLAKRLYADGEQNLLTVYLNPVAQCDFDDPDDQEHFYQIIE